MFSDHDNLSNAAAAAPAPEIRTAPNSANPETNATVEGAAVEPAARRASEPAEAVNAAQETPAAIRFGEAKPAAENARGGPGNPRLRRGGCRLEEMSKLLEE